MRLFDDELRKANEERLGLGKLPISRGQADEIGSYADCVAFAGDFTTPKKQKEAGAVVTKPVAEERQRTADTGSDCGSLLPLGIVAAAVLLP